MCICMYNNDDSANASNHDTKDNHHVDIYVHSYLHCHSGLFRDHCSGLWLYLPWVPGMFKSADMGIPIFKQRMSPKLVLTKILLRQYAPRHPSNTVEQSPEPGFETKNGSVIEIGLGLPKPFSQEVNNPFIFMKGTLNKPSRNPLLQCLYRAQEIGGPQSPEFYTSSTK